METETVTLCEYCGHDLIKFQTGRLGHLKTNHGACAVMKGDFVCGCDCPMKEVNYP
jgi:hypothetical protein